MQTCRTIKEEYLIYDLKSLAGDVGGVIGILLGASVLTLYDAVQKFLKGFFTGGDCRRAITL